MGIGLLLFEVFVLSESRKGSLLSLLLISRLDLLWVAGSLNILLLDPFGISFVGNLLIGIIAIIVPLFAAVQLFELWQADLGSGKGVKRLTFSRILLASKSEVWKVISDVENYHVIAPNVDAVEILSGEGKGMQRKCSHGKDSWTESCTLWKEEEEYSFRVNTQAPDYLFPFEYLSGSWKVKEVSSSTTQLSMIFEFKYKRAIYNILLHPFLKIKFNQTGYELLDNWQKVLLEKEGAFRRVEA